MTNRTTEEIEAAVNSPDPKQAIAMVIELFQRFVIAHEKIADGLGPEVLLKASTDQ